MSLDTVSQLRLAEVWPVLAARITQLAATLEAQGIDIRVVQGLRTVAQQDALYAQGRTTPGKVVTNCRGGYSWHNYGMAVDCVPGQDIPNAPAYIPDWNPEHPSWLAMEAAARSLGLTCGADWRTFVDYPHFQLTGQYPDGAPDDEVRQIAKNQGLKALWSTVNV